MQFFNRWALRRETVVVQWAIALKTVHIRSFLYLCVRSKLRKTLREFDLGNKLFFIEISCGESPDMFELK